jgi:hypothetical protein
MQCFVCGEQMRVVMVEPHIIAMQGFERRTFQCVGCGDAEKRPVFDSTQLRPAPVPIPEPIAGAQPQAPVQSSKVKSLLGEPGQAARRAPCLSFVVPALALGLAEPSRAGRTAPIISAASVGTP